MNLSINLIAESERRSASAVNPAFLLRAAAIGIPALIVAALASAYVSVKTMERDLVSQEDALARLKPSLEAVARIRKQATQFRAMVGMIESWQATRLEWHEQLALIRETVPLTVQLTRIRVDDFSQMLDGKPARGYAVQIQGKTGGLRAESNVQTFRENLALAESLTPFVDTAEIPPGTFVQDPAPTAQKTDRLFEMRVTYKPRVAE